MKVLLIGLLFALPVLADDKAVEKIIYIRDGQVTTLWQNDSSEEGSSQKPCLQDISLRIADGQMVTTKNPFYDDCVKQQIPLVPKLNAQERGGDL